MYFLFKPIDFIDNAPNYSDMFENENFKNSLPTKQREQIIWSVNIVYCAKNPV